jgi:Leucine-rich repeat (LRR) protein
LSSHANGANEITCDIKEIGFVFTNATLRTCDLNSQSIDQPNTLISSESDSTMKGLATVNNKNIKFIPENIFAKFPNLEHMQFWRTSINSIAKKHFKGFSKLKYLNLGYNEIETVEKGSFDDLENLDYLGLGNNKIEYLSSEAFKSLTKLENLYLYSNQIEFLPENIFSSLNNLQRLDLKNNQITFLSENIFNSLTEIPKNLFSQNSKLENIWLNENKIKSMSSALFDGKNDLEFIYLTGTCADRDYYKLSFETMKDDLKSKCTESQKVVDHYRLNLESIWERFANEREKKNKLTNEISELKDLIADLSNKTIHLEDKKATKAVKSDKKSIFDNVLIKIFFGNWKYILS